jgi:hypothetical protein
MPTIVPFSFVACLAVLAALPTVAPAQMTIPPVDEKRAEANVFMNAKVIAIDRSRDRIEVRDNDGVRRTFVLDDDATLPAGRVRSGTEVILSVKQRGNTRRVVSVQPSEPAPAARVPESRSEPTFIPAPDNRLRTAADQVAFQSGTVAAGANPSAPVPQGVPYVAGSSGGFVDPATGLFTPGVVPTVVGDAAASNLSTASAQSTAAGNNGVQAPSPGFEAGNVVGLATRRTLTNRLQGTTTRSTDAASSGRILNEPVVTNRAPVLGPGAAPIVDPVSGALIGDANTPAGTGTVVVTDPTTGLPLTVPASALQPGAPAITTGTRQLSTRQRAAGTGVASGVRTGTTPAATTTGTTSGTTTTAGTTAATGATSTTGTINILNAPTTGTTRLRPAAGAAGGAVRPSTASGSTATGTASTPTTTGTSTTTNITGPNTLPPAGTTTITTTPSGSFVTTPFVTGATRPAVRTFTNADLIAAGRTTTPGGAATGRTFTSAGSGVPVAQQPSAGGGEQVAGSGFVGVPGSFAPTGPVTVQISGTAGTTADSTHAAPDFGGLGADAAPLPTARAVQAFEASMARLAARVEEVDSAFARYRDSCLGLPSVFGLQARSWMGIWDGQTTPTETNDQCEPMLSYAIRIGESVQRGVRTAEDQARRSGVLPGVRRQIRAQYGMEWDGWDH